MDRAGEIDRLAEIVRPHIAVITNIGVSHIENLGSREGIFHAKMEVAKHISSMGQERGAADIPVGRPVPDEGEYQRRLPSGDGRRGWKERLYNIRY